MIGAEYIETEVEQSQICTNGIARQTSFSILHGSSLVIYVAKLLHSIQDPQIVILLEDCNIGCCVAFVIITASF